MKLKIDTVIKKMNGSPVRVIASGQEELIEGIQSGVIPEILSNMPKKTDLTLREAIRVSLVSDTCEDAQGKPDHEARFSKFKVASKVADAKATIELDIKEVIAIQDSVKKHYTTEIMGAVLMLLDR